LAQKSDDLTMEDLAGYAFDSLRNKIMPLPDDILVYPAHGAGSACGKNMMKETVDTLGNQKKMNYALRADMTKEEFIKEVTEDLTAPPAYFPLNVQLNREGYQPIGDIIKTGLNPLSPAAFEALANEQEALMLDVRSPAEFAEGHVPNSIFIGMDGSFAPWVGELIVDIKQPIILIAPEGREQEAITRLSRVGFDQTLGYLSGGIDVWKEAGRPIEQVERITADELSAIIDNPKTRLFDVRKPSEFQASYVVDATNVPLNSINDHLAAFPKDQKFHIHCAGGYRSMIAASILKSRGYHDLVDIEGGFKSIKKTAIPTTEFVCPSTIKS